MRNTFRTTWTQIARNETSDDYRLKKPRESDLQNTFVLYEKVDHMCGVVFLSRRPRANYRCIMVRLLCFFYYDQ